MRLKTALAILLPAVLASCAVNHHTAQHVADIDRYVGMRQDYARNPPPPEPGRSIQEQNCVGPMVPVTGNLVCE